MEEAIRIFRLVATEFADVPDDTVSQWLELVSPLVSKRIFGKLYYQALAFLVAHRMKMAGMGDSSYGTVADSMRISSYSEGSTSVSFSSGQSSDMSVDSELSMTVYGLQYLSLRRLVVVPIRSAGER